MHKKIDAHARCAAGFLLAAVSCASDRPPTAPAPEVTPPQTTSGSTLPQPSASAAGTAAPAPHAGQAATAAGSAAHTAAAGEAGARATAGVPAAGSGSPASVAGAGVIATSAGAPSTSPTLAPQQTVIPHASWDCGMPEGIPAATGNPVFDAQFTVGEIRDLGPTQYGRRHQIDITGGKVTGPKLDAEVLARGLDYQLVLANGALEVEQINILRTSDRSLIYVRTCGTAPGPDGEVRITMDFEAPNDSAYAFLNTGHFVGTRVFDMIEKTLELHVFEAGTPDAQNTVRVENPAGVPDQSWDCKVAPSGSGLGATVYTESVGIGGGSLSVGESKRGNRNIIPITGGTTTGRVPGKVLSGGADFQIIADGTFHDLDARYSLLTDDGEVIIVRNCGPIGALVPVFEASSSGKYAWLNENNWLSSDPGLALGAVNLTIYETR